jgi:hypothetical protein
MMTIIMTTKMKKKEIEVHITLDTMRELLAGAELISEIERVGVRLRCPSVYHLLINNNDKDLTAFKKLIEGIDKLLAKYK